MYFSLVVTSMSVYLPSGKAPTTRVRRRISLLRRSMALLVLILVIVSGVLVQAKRIETALSERQR